MMLKSFRKNRYLHVKRSLVGQRRMVSLLDKELALAGREIRRETINWVPMWVDFGNSVRCNARTATALRAITDRGELLWYVRHDTRKHGYHAMGNDPESAFEEAAHAWAKRRHVREQWPHVQSLASDLLRGRRKMLVTLRDAHESALCSLGIDGFMRRTGIKSKTTISGRLAAMLMKVEPQMGFVLHQAALREGGAPGITRFEP